MHLINGNQPHTKVATVGQSGTFLIITRNVQINFYALAAWLPLIGSSWGYSILGFVLDWSNTFQTTWNNFINFTKDSHPLYRLYCLASGKSSVAQ